MLATSDESVVLGAGTAAEVELISAAVIWPAAGDSDAPAVQDLASATIVGPSADVRHHPSSNQTSFSLKHSLNC